MLGSGAATAAMALALASRLASGAQMEPGAVIEALHELPMEP